MLIGSPAHFAVKNLVLEGEFVTPTDISSLPRTAPLYALAYGINSLYLGLLFKVPPTDIRQRASLVRQYTHAGIGTVFRPFCRVLLAIAELNLDDGTVTEPLESTCTWLTAFPQSKCSLQLSVVYPC